MTNSRAVQLAKRTCLLVLGMHRSGTSALTRVLSIVGASLPANIVSSTATNPTGHWESEPLRRCFDKMLAELGTSWRDPRAIELGRVPAQQLEEIRENLSGLLRTEYAEGEIFVVKDPRICRFAPLFLDVLDRAAIDVRVVHIFRNPLEVVESLERRNGMGRSLAGLLWLRHVLDAERAGRSRPRALVTYDALLADWRSCLDEIAARTGVAWPRDPKDVAVEVERFLDDSHRHHTCSAEDVLHDADFRGWVAEAFHALSILSHDPEATAAVATLDRIAGELRDAGPILGRLTDENQRYAEKEAAAEADARKLGSTLATLRAELDTTKATLRSRNAELNAALAQQRAAASAAATRSERFKARREALRDRNRRIARRLKKREREMRSLKATFSWRVTAPLRWLSSSLRRLFTATKATWRKGA